MKEGTARFRLLGEERNNNENGRRGRKEKYGTRIKSPPLETSAVSWGGAMRAMRWKEFIVDFRIRRNRSVEIDI